MQGEFKLNHKYNFNKVGYLPLTKGRIAYFDIEDFPKLAKYRWSIQLCFRTQYAHIKINNKSVLMHNLLLPKREGLIVDHINGDTMDNRKSNLRYATRQINALNTSKFKGYYYSSERKKWRCNVQPKGYKYLRKQFATEKEAINAVKIYKNNVIKLELAKINDHQFYRERI